MRYTFECGREILQHRVAKHQATIYQYHITISKFNSSVWKNKCLQKGKQWIFKTTILIAVKVKECLAFGDSTHLTIYTFRARGSYKDRCRHHTKAFVQMGLEFCCLSLGRVRWISVGLWGGRGGREHRALAGCCSHFGRLPDPPCCRRTPRESQGRFHNERRSRSD